MLKRKLISTYKFVMLSGTFSTDRTEKLL